MRIYFSANQSVASVINQINRTKEKDLQLVFPEDSRFLGDDDNVELLKNQALLGGKQISVITPNSEYVQSLRAQGISADLKASGQAPDEVKPVIQQEISEAKGPDFISNLQGESPEEAAFTKRYFDLGPKSAPESQPQEITSRTPEPEEPAETASFSQVPTQAVQDNTEAQEAMDVLFSPKAEDAAKEPIEEEIKEVSQQSSKALIYKVVGGAVIVGALGFLYFYLPKAVIEVFPQRTKMSFSFEVAAAKDVAVLDVEKRAIPLQILEVQKEFSKPFEVKQESSAVQKAKGRITVYNELSTPQVMIPSRFQASNGNIYWSQRNIQIPKNGSLEIDVVADKAGSTHNLTCTEKEPCSFTIPAWKGSDNFSKIYGKATESIKGGSSGKGFVVSDEEYQKAQVALRTELVDEAQKEFASKIPAGFSLLEDTAKTTLIGISSNPPIGSISADGKATISGKMHMKGFLVREEDLKSLANTLISGQLSNDREPKVETVKVEYTIAKADYDKNSLVLNVTASEEVVYKMDINDIKSRFAGKSEDGVRGVIESMPNVQSAHVTLWPFWVRAIPNKPDRIIIEIK